MIVAKVEATLQTLRTCIPPSRARDVAFAEAERTIAHLQAGRAETVQAVFLAEARAAAAYFAAWRTLPIRWKAKARYPIPDHWAEIQTRRTLRDGPAATNRNATHPVNAMLNYGYALLYSQVQTEAVTLGFDPRLGIMHADRTDAPALILDLMEPRRPLVDAAILQFVGANTFSGSDFVLTREGVCRVTPQLARRVAELV